MLEICEVGATPSLWLHKLRATISVNTMVKGLVVGRDRSGVGNTTSLMPRTNPVQNPTRHWQNIPGAVSSVIVINPLI
jgi:hypothetical protein